MMRRYHQLTLTGLASFIAVAILVYVMFMPTVAVGLTDASSASNSNAAMEEHAGNTENATQPPENNRMFEMPVEKMDHYSNLVEADLETTGLGSMGVKIKNVDNILRYFGAIHGHWVIQRQIYLGAGAYYLLGPEYSTRMMQDEEHGRFPPYTYDQDLNLKMIIAGLESGYILHMNSQLTLGIQLLLGITSIFYSYQTLDGAQNFGGNDTIVLEPAITLDWIPLKGCHIYTAVGYHYAMGAEGVESIPRDALNSPTLELGLRFGGF